MAKQPILVLQSATPGPISTGRSVARSQARLPELCWGVAGDEERGTSIMGGGGPKIKDKKIVFLKMFSKKSNMEAESWTWPIMSSKPVIDLFWQRMWNKVSKEVWGMSLDPSYPILDAKIIKAENSAACHPRPQESPFFLPDFTIPIACHPHPFNINGHVELGCKGTILDVYLCFWNDVFLDNTTSTYM